MLRTISILQSISSIKQSLKILELTAPTTKAAIKKQYITMAKKYHPDSAETEGSKANTSGRQSKINEEIQRKFVEVNKAYQYLKDIPEQDINSNYQKSAQQPSGTSAGTQERKTRMTADEIKRQMAYEYFNRKQASQRVQNQHKEQAEQVIKERKPLYKTMPELMVGFMLLAVMLGDWSYRVLKRKRMEGEAQKNPTVRAELQRQKMRKAFRSLNQPFALKKINIKQEVD